MMLRGRLTEIGPWWTDPDDDEVVDTNNGSKGGRDEKPDPKEKLET